MEKDIERVRRVLRMKVVAGYNPLRTSESAEDHWTDWFILTQEEFDRIKAEAAETRKG